MSEFTGRFEVGDKVIVDGHRDLIMVITAYIFRMTPKGDVYPSVEVSYVANSEAKLAIVEEWRLAP